MQWLMLHTSSLTTGGSCTRTRLLSLLPTAKVQRCLLFFPGYRDSHRHLQKFCLRSFFHPNFTSFTAIISLLSLSLSTCTPGAGEQFVATTLLVSVIVNVNQSFNRLLSLCPQSYCITACTVLPSILILSLTMRKWPIFLWIRPAMLTSQKISSVAAAA